MRAGHVPERAVVSRALAGDPPPRARNLLAQLAEAGCAVHVAPDEAMTDLTCGRGLGDILGLLRMPDSASIERILSADGNQRRPVVVAVDIFDPGNCGALVRTALAGNACLFVAAGKTDPFHPKAVQTSMGSLFKIPITRATDADAPLSELREAGLRLIGMTCTADALLHEAGLGGRRVAVVLGAEAFGLPREIVDALDLEVRIPMPPGVDSFSVNAATAIVLYEINRRQAADQA